MNLTEERMGQMALAYIIWMIRNRILSIDNFRDRVRFTAKQLGMSDDEAMTFVEEVFQRSREDDIHDAFAGTIT